MSILLKRAAAALLATTAVIAIASTAQAQTFKGKSAGDIIVRARALAVVPDEKADVKTVAGSTTIGTATVSSDHIPELDFSYFVTDNIALELIAGTSRHRVKATLPTVGGDTEVGKVSLLPPTLSAQYHFLPKNQFSPYVGAGINYTLFYREDAANNANSIGLRIVDTDYKNRFGFSLQAGFDYFVTDNILINVDVKKLFLSTKLTGTTAGVAVVPWKSDVRLDPWIFGLGVGYKF